MKARGTPAARSPRRGGRTAAVGWIAIVLITLAGCATPPRDPAELAAFKAQHDPLEPLNRKIFAFNEAADRAVIKPVAKEYARLPAPVRDGVRNFLDNLLEPVVVANNVLQGRLRSAGMATARFVVNTVAGPAGVRDVAARNRLPRQGGDFGQTLYAWGFPAGPYLVLPLFGPSSPRDAVGQGVDVYLDPFRYIARRQNWPTMMTSSRTIVRGIDQRSRNLESLYALRRTSVDFYAALRSYYRQNRAIVLRHGRPAAPVPASFYEDPGAGAPSAGDGPPR